MDQLTRDGVVLAFEDAGKGAPPILLVHDPAIDPTSMRPQLEGYAHAARAASTEVHLLNTQALLQSDLTAARAIYQSALQLVRPFDAPAVAGVSEINLATAALRQGDVDESARPTCCGAGR